MDRISLHNFKCFKDKDIDIRKLTVFAGVNASGKSTVIQAILLVRIAIEKKLGEIQNNFHKNDDFKITHLSLSGEYCLSLGNTNEIINNDPSDNHIRIKLINDENCFSELAFDIDPSKDEFFIEDAILSCDEMKFEGDLKDQMFFLPEFYYLNAERIGPRLRQDISYSDILWTGPKGENLGHVIADNDFTKIIGTKTFPFGSNRSPLFKDQLRMWLDFIIPGIDIDAEISKETSSANILLKRGTTNEKYSLPTNLGFGITYVLPIIVCGLLSGENNILIIENPEAHLHPASQTAIGKFLTFMASAGTTIIVETHSEHVISGIRIGSIDKKINKDVLINFFEINDHNEVEVEPISLDKDSDLTKWPNGFFDQSQKDFVELMEKRKA
jgi:predicted ATPase